LLPSEFLNLDLKERAFITASVLLQIEQEKAEQAKIKTPKRR